MASFDIAIPVILEHEGGFVDNVHDPGGATKYGISLRFAKQLGLDIDLDGDIDPDDIKAVNLSKALELYYTLFWYPGYFDTINDQESATKLFDCAVNMGPKRATTLACRVVAIPVPDLIMTLNDKINDTPGDEFVYGMCTQMTDFYVALAQKNPQMRVFLKGWISRAKWPFINRELVQAQGTV